MNKFDKSFRVVVGWSEKMNLAYDCSGSTLLDWDLFLSAMDLYFKVKLPLEKLFKNLALKMLKIEYLKGAPLQTGNLDKNEKSAPKMNFSSKKCKFAHSVLT
jgi:hypothetical protein